MNATVQSYLFFAGRCEEAINFYQKAIGAEIGLVMRFSESPDPPPPGMVPPGFDNKIMHAEFQVGQTTIMASDGTEEESRFGGFRLALTFPTVAEVDRAFAALSAGGNVDMPLDTTFWSPRFGMLTDKFGVGWMVMAPETKKN